MNIKAQPMKRTCSGQAVVEMAVGLIVIMVVMTAVIQIGLLCCEHAKTMIVARREAGNFVLTPDHIRSLSGNYILNWWVGPDGEAYSRDDRPIAGSAYGEESAVIATYVDPGALEALAPANPFSKLLFASSLLEEFGLVKGRHSGSAPNLPVMRRLMYNNRSETIDVESEAWLVWAGGLYEDSQ